MIREVSIRRHRPALRAMSIVEAAASIMIAAVVIVAVLNTSGAARFSQYKTGDRRLGYLLAESLMSEILQKDYEDPNETPIFGRESSEAPDHRVDYDDVDDYHGWDGSPPEYQDGTPLADRQGWCRSVTVQYVNPTDMKQSVPLDPGLKRITVIVSHNGAVVASLVAIQSRRTAATASGTPAGG